MTAKPSIEHKWTKSAVRGVGVTPVVDISWSSPPTSIRQWLCDHWQATQLPNRYDPECHELVSSNFDTFYFKLEGGTTRVEQELLQLKHLRLSQRKLGRQFDMDHTTTNSKQWLEPFLSTLSCRNVYKPTIVVTGNHIKFWKSMNQVACQVLNLEHELKRHTSSAGLQPVQRRVGGGSARSPSTLDQTRHDKRKRCRRLRTFGNDPPRYDQCSFTAFDDGTSARRLPRQTFRGRTGALHALARSHTAVDAMWSDYINTSQPSPHLQKNEISIHNWLLEELILALSILSTGTFCVQLYSIQSTFTRQWLAVVSLCFRKVVIIERPPHGKLYPPGNVHRRLVASQPTFPDGNNLCRL
jgi:hypothetical protein